MAVSMIKLLSILAAVTLPAQDLPQDAGHLWQTENAWALGAGATLATAAYATDDTPRDQLSSVDGVARVTDVYGAGTFSIPATIGLWGVGHTTQHRGLRDFGYGLTRTLGLTQLVVGPLKVASHRLRPNGANHRSFPSGHTANTFAIARFVQRQTNSWVSVPFYGMAVLTGAGRIEGRQHYLSDVVMGATVGLIVGSTVGREPSSATSRKQEGRVRWQPMTRTRGLKVRIQLN